MTDYLKNKEDKKKEKKWPQKQNSPDPLFLKVMKDLYNWEELIKNAYSIQENVADP